MNYNSYRGVIPVYTTGSLLVPLANGERVTLKVIDGTDHFFRDLYAEEIADGAVGFIEAR